MGMEKLTTGRDAELADTLRRVIVDGIRAEVELGGARQMESRARVTEDYRGSALFVDLAKEAGARHPEQLAQQLMRLYDGAGISRWMDHDPKRTHGSPAR